MKTRLHRIDSAGTRVRSLDGGGTQPALVMLHAGGLCAGVFEPLVHRLGPHCRPVAIDLRGHGASSAPAKLSDFGYATLTGDVFAVLDELGIQSAFGIGHSLGGGVLLRAAIERPGFFPRLVVCEAAATSVDPEMLERRVQRLSAASSRRRTVWRTPDDLIERYRAKVPFDRFTLESLQALARWGLTIREDNQYELACPPAVEAGYYATCLSAIGAGTIEHRLREIPGAGTHCTIVRGLKSPFPEASHQMQVDALKGEVFLFDGGHFFPQEDPDLAAQLLKKVLLNDSSPSR